MLGLDRNGIMCITLLMLMPYSATIDTMLQLYADPRYDPEAGVEQPSWWEKHWLELLLGVANIVIGVVQLATCNPMGILSIVSGVASIVGACFSEQLAGAIGMATTGAQAIAVGIMSLTCNPVYGLISIATGVACVTFATAEAQESLGYGNWMKDAGMSDGWYTGLMATANVAAIAVNLVGVKQCFKEGTLVETEEGLKPIEEIKVGDLVLAYDEATGEQAYKPVARLFRNTTEEWYHIHVNGEEIVCTGGHPFYVVNATADRQTVNYEGQPQNAKGAWICANELRIGDKLLLADGTIVAIETVTAEKLSAPEITYNFEVAKAHTYYVSDSKVLVHNDCTPGSAKRYSIHESRNAAFRAAKRDAGIPMGQQPLKVTQSVDKLGRVISGRTYIFESGQNAITIMEHAAGHVKGGIGPHFNISGVNWHYLYP